MPPPPTSDERDPDPPSAGKSSGVALSDRRVERAAKRPLDFYTNKSALLACEYPRKGLRSLSSDGRWVRVRCGLNRCRGCYGVKSLLRAQMVYEDALIEAPTYAITLTTRASTWDAKTYRRAKENVLRALRARFGRVEMLEFIEQTSGQAVRSGGHKRGHGHNLLKGIPYGHALEIERIVVPIWKCATGAWQVNVTELKSAGGAVAYLTLNLALEKGKAVQAPVDLPKGTRTLRATRGYWSVPAPELQERARVHHAKRRLSHALVMKLVDETGCVDGDFLELVLEVEWEAHEATTWEIWKVHEHPDSVGVFEPIEPIERRPLLADLLPLSGLTTTMEMIPCTHR